MMIAKLGRQGIRSRFSGRMGVMEVPLRGVQPDVARLETTRLELALPLHLIDECFQVHGDPPFLPLCVHSAHAGFHP